MSNLPDRIVFEVAERLETAAHALTAAAAALELLGTPESRKHAREMRGGRGDD